MSKRFYQNWPVAKPEFNRILLSIGILLVLPTTLNSYSIIRHIVGLVFFSALFWIWIGRALYQHRSIKLPSIVFPVALYAILRFLLAFFAPLRDYSLYTAASDITFLILFLFFLNSFELGWRASIWFTALFATTIFIYATEFSLFELWLVKWRTINGTLFPLPPFRYRLPGYLLQGINSLGAFSALITPFIVTNIISARKITARINWILLFATALLFLYFSASRSGWLGLSAGLIVTLFLIWRQNWHKQAQAKKHLFFILGVMILLALVSLKQVVFSGKQPFSDARSDIWYNSWILFLQSPLWGQGTSSIAPLYAQLIQAPPGFVALHAHNIELEILAESGLLGFAVVSIGFWLLWKYIRQNSTKFQSPSHSMKMAAFIGAGVVFFVENQGDYFMWTPIYALAVILLVALFIHYLEPPALHIPSPIIFGVLITLYVVVISSTIWMLSGNSLYEQGIKAAQQRNWEVARQKICTVAEKYPTKTLFSFQCSLATAHTTSDADTLTAIYLQQNALNTDPYWAVHRANLAMMLWYAGNRNQAQIEMRKAADQAPNNALFSLNLAWMLEQNQETEHAQQWYAKTLEQAPSFANDLFFTQTPLRKKALATMPVYQDPLAEGWNALNKNDFTAAETFFSQKLNSSPKNAAAYAGLALALQGLNQPNAEYLLNTAQFIAPTNWRIVQASATFLRNMGKEGKAASLLDAYFKNLTDSINSSEMYYSDLYYYGAYHFPPTLSFDLVPQIIRPMLPVQMANELHWLAEYYRKHNNVDSADEIEFWLENLYHAYP